MTLFVDPSPSYLEKCDWTPTRAAGLHRLEAFLPYAGRAYARDRNVDRGPSDRSNVSALSPWIRRRLITEEEVIGTVLNRHSFAAAEKFIQEVFWRSYWKGWLEMRPSVLLRFNAEKKALLDAWAGDARLQRAIEGRTGILCFDAWVQELVEIGWLHNHARMWFASIWTFTLRLPWQLGAAFFYKHLMDADPASNTLSWRWVAGLHTRGKHYLAQPNNIRENTVGRFDPAGQLDDRAAPLTECGAIPAPMPFRVGDTVSSKRLALLLTEEDLYPESWALRADVAACAAMKSPKTGNENGPAARFGEGALYDGLMRARNHFNCAADLFDTAQIVRWSKSVGVEEVATAYPPIGSIASALNCLEIELQREGIRLLRLRRSFDDSVWLHAKAGFFKLKERIPHFIARFGATS